MRTLTALLVVCAVIMIGPARAGAEKIAFVKDGQPLAVREDGGGWESGDGFLHNQGEGEYLHAERAVGPGDFHISVKISLQKLDHTAASFAINEDSNFGFDGGDQELFVEGPLFGGSTRTIGDASEYISAGDPFRFEVIRDGKTITFRIDGQEVYTLKKRTEAFSTFALRPWRSTMRVYDFVATGNLTAPPRQPQWRKYYDIPILDISDETDRQVIVARGSEKTYHGHPDTLLLPDGETMYCVWTYNHGGRCGPMKKSTDAGLTWSKMLDTPDNWSDIENCPTIHRLVDPEGNARLFVFAGNGDMYQSVSTDGGETWSPMEKNGLQCVVVPLTILPVQDGEKLLMWYHRRRRENGRKVVTVWQSASTDGGLTWGESKKVVDVPGADPCEPSVIRSPDGDQLLMFMRENTRRLNSLYAVSNDEGKTWSDARELPASLTGDRHMPRYAPDGRLVVVFRDMAAESPTKGSFVGWVGTYEDIIEGREGQYRVKLLHQYPTPGRGWSKNDCGYPGLELLPDGTFVATTYVKYRPGPEKNSVVSVRFKMSELDKKAEKLPEKKQVYASGKDGYHTYRIPSLVVTTKGTLLAFCEGRKNSRSDHGNIDLMLKRSTDKGRTWSEQQIVHEEGGDKKITIGNPCAVVDEDTNTIWLAFCRNNDRVFITHSEDDGKTWAEPREITGNVKEPEWGWYATGPGHGIQLTRGEHDGRLVLPCDCGDSKGWGNWNDKGHSLVIYSDDHGKTWTHGELTEKSMNECEVVELADGSLLLSMRNYRGPDRRAFAVSRDGGETWSSPKLHEQVYDPTCQSSIHRYSFEPKNRILYSGPGGPGRRDLTIRLSRDEGDTWPVHRVLERGPSAYSDLAVLPNGDVGCLYEAGDEHPYETITFARFPLQWLQESPGD